MFNKIQDTTLVEQVTQQIQQLILNNHLRPGDKLPAERILCEELGVSRTVVREATRSLVAKGLVDVSPGRGGVTIRQPTAEQTTESMTLYLNAGRGGVNYEKVLEVRRCLEADIAALATIRRTDEDLHHLEKLLTVPLHTSADADAFAQQDQAFHDALARATHNEIFVLLLASLNDWMFDLRRKAFQVLRQTPSMTQHHFQIFERVQAGDGPGARAAMVAHIDEAERIQYAALALNQQELA